MPWFAHAFLKFQYSTKLAKLITRKRIKKDFFKHAFIKLKINEVSDKRSRSSGLLINTLTSLVDLERTNFDIFNVTFIYEKDTPTLYPLQEIITNKKLQVNIRKSGKERTLECVG